MVFFLTHSAVLRCRRYRRNSDFCLFVCLSVRSHIKNHTSVKISPYYSLYMLPMAVARSSSDGNAIRYVLPVWWMTSCFLAFVSSTSPGGGTVGEVCRLRLHLVIAVSRRNAIPQTLRDTEAHVRDLILVKHGPCPIGRERRICKCLTWMCVGRQRSRRRRSSVVRDDSMNDRQRRSDRWRLISTFINMRISTTDALTSVICKIQRLENRRMTNALFIISLPAGAVCEVLWWVRLCVCVCLPVPLLPLSFTRTPNLITVSLSILSSLSINYPVSSRSRTLLLVLSLKLPSYALFTGSGSLNASNTSSSHLPTKFSQLPNLHIFISSSLFNVLAVLTIHLSLL